MYIIHNTNNRYSFKKFLSIVKLAEQSCASEDPVFDRLVRGEMYGQHIVSRVSGSGECPTSC